MSSSIKGEEASGSEWEVSFVIRKGGVEAKSVVATIVATEEEMAEFAENMLMDLVHRVEGRKS
jgi:hypothetical protein